MLDADFTDRIKIRESQNPEKAPEKEFWQRLKINESHLFPGHERLPCSLTWLACRQQKKLLIR